MDSIKIIKIVVLIIFLGFTGYYTFKYLAKGTKMLSNITKHTGKTVEKGFAKTLNFVGIGGSSISKKLTATLSPTPAPAPIPSSPERTSTLTTAVNEGNGEYTSSYVSPDSSTDSPIQTGRQKGYCYIGVDRGIRSCITVDDPDMCMSGQIFPTKAVCINPTLRAGLSNTSQSYYYEDGVYRQGDYFNGPAGQMPTCPPQPVPPGSPPPPPLLGCQTPDINANNGNNGRRYNGNNGDRRYSNNGRRYYGNNGGGRYSNNGNNGRRYSGNNGGGRYSNNGQQYSSMNQYIHQQGDTTIAQSRYSNLSNNGQQTLGGNSNQHTFTAS